MTPRNNRPASSPRPAAVPIHRGPQAMSPVAASPYNVAPFQHAPNAALLIDFDILFVVLTSLAARFVLDE